MIIEMQPPRIRRMVRVSAFSKSVPSDDAELLAAQLEADAADRVDDPGGRVVSHVQLFDPE
jgi:hypothetical protein